MKKLAILTIIGLVFAVVVINVAGNAFESFAAEVNPHSGVAGAAYNTNK